MSLRNKKYSGGGDRQKDSQANTHNSPFRSVQGIQFTLSENTIEVHNHISFG